MKRFLPVAVISVTLSLILFGVGQPHFLRAEEGGASTFFGDVEHGAFYDKSVEAFARKGIVKGYENGDFGPDNPVTRAQVTVMIDRYDQEVVEPLRQQIAKLRELLDLGRCGDGIIGIGEECDDGNNVNGDGCSSECQEEVKELPSGKCGNGVIDRGEQCDDGNTNNYNDGCNDQCQLLVAPEPVCGNEICERGEANKTNPGGCGPNADPGCLGPPGEFRPGSCPGDCEQSACGNGVCDRDEGAYGCDPTDEGTGCEGYKYCPEDCEEDDNGAVCGNDTCEEGEADKTYPGGCLPNADLGCLGPPAEFKPGSCPEDCPDAQPTSSCSETDNGRDLSKQGWLTFVSSQAAGTRNDICVRVTGEGNTRRYDSLSECSGSDCYLYELYCQSDKSFREEYVSCKFGCRDGACLKKSPACGNGVCDPDTESPGCGAEPADGKGCNFGGKTFCPEDCGYAL